MFWKTTFRFTAMFVAASAFAAIHVAAQDTQDAPSVAEAARRAREQKDAAAAKPAKVITNESLPPAPTPDPSAAPAVNPNPPAPAADQGSSDAADNDAEGKKKAVDELKQQIADKQKSVDLLQRELALEQDNFYSKQDYQRDAAGKQKLDSMQSDLKTQQGELAALKAKLADAGGGEESKEPAPGSKEPTTAAPPATPPQN
jgi:hypothetical protein